jgi:hypothetical protein
MGSIADAADEGARRVLAIGAQAGDQGVQAYQQAQAQVGQIQQDALGRLGNDVSQINAPTGLRGELGTLITRPTTQLQQEMAAGQGRFSADIARSSYDNLGYLNSLKGIEPMIDKMLAAQAAASGGGGSGGGGSGGGGRGGGGGGDNLSDSELRKQLSGAASQVRESNIQAAAANLQAAGQQRKAVAQQVKAVKGQVQKNVQVLKTQAKPTGKGSVVVLAKKYQDASGQKKKKLGKQLIQARNRTLGATAGGARANTAYTKAIPVASAAQRAQRGAYSGLVQTRNASLGDIARQIGVDAGEDPNRVFGLIGPTEDKSFRLADANRNKAEGGTISALGAPPTLGKFAAAAELKVTPKKAAVMRKSQNYDALSQVARQAIQKGKTFEEFKNDLNPSRVKVEPVYKRNGDPKVGKNGQQVTKTTRFDNVVNLILMDYAPAFTS